MERILVVEDDATIANAIADRLRSEGFAVVTESDGLAALDVARREQPDLVLVDLMLPGLDGVELCRRLHLERQVPVIMVTARDDESDLLVGLAVGADDYLTKPFSMRELVARVRTVLRRTGQALAPIEAGSAMPLSVGARTIDASRRTVHLDGVEVQLTPTEFDLVLCLARRGGAVRTREQLLHDVWGYRDGSGARTVDSHIRALRRKLGDDIIRTVHGVGYAIGDGISK